VMFLEQKRIWTTNVEVTDSGHVVNFTTFTLDSPSDHPAGPVLLNGLYYSAGADYSFSGYLYPDGTVVVGHMTPGVNMSGSQTANGAWSLRVYASWYV